MVRNSEGDWMLGSSSLSPPSHPSVLGTSPSGVSDLSNEAQGHSNSSSNTKNGNLSENSDLGISPPSMAARYYDSDNNHLNNHSHSNPTSTSNPTTTATSSSSPHLEYPNGNGINNQMSTDSRPSFQSHRSSIDPLISINTQTSSSIPNILHSPSLADLSNHAGSNFTGMTTSGSGFSQSTHQTTTLGGGAAGQDEVVPTTFDEGMLRALCDMDCGMPLLYDRIKQSMASAREASSFFKKRAVIEEEYARAMSKLARSSSEQYGITDGKAGSFVNSWQSMLRTHEVLGENRLRFAAKLGEMSEELSNLSKEVDKNRKQTRETGVRLEKNLQDAEAGVEKARARFDSAAEDLERLLLLKSGESTKGGELQTGSGPGGKRTLGKAIGKGGLLFKNKNPQQILKQEEDIRSRTSTASDAFRKEVLSTQAMRQEYFNLQLPRILRSLKESAEEIDNGTQYHLARYAFLFESTILGDGMAVTPVGAPESASGLKNAVDSIDNRADFKTFVQNYQVAHGRDYRGPRRDGPYEEGFIPPSASISKGSSPSAQAPSQRPIFGIELATQMARDGVEVPPILEKCASAIESIGLQSMGIYRLSGTTSKVQRLKAKFDQDWNAVDLMNDEAINDINIIAACLKLWLRELPEPLLTHELYQGFIDSAKIENDRLRHIRLHEQVNELPDANYASLKFLMGHLDKVRSEESVNQMSVSNLAIVFGPTLLSPPPGLAESGAAGPGGVHLQDMSFQCKAVETILEKYKEIFVEE